MSYVEPEDELVELAKMGMEAEIFMTTPLGRFLEKKAKQEESDAIELLVNSDPDDAKINREMRNQIHVARMFLTWMQEAIQVGTSALQLLRQQEQDARE